MFKQKKDLISSLCLFVLGLLMAFQSIKYSLWGWSGPEAGFFPFVVAVIMIGLSLFISLKSFVLIRLQKKYKILEEERKNEVSIFKVSSYIILILLYGVLIDKIGYLITSALFLLFVIKYVEKQNWKITILVGLASIITSYVLFVYFLGVPLPRGLLRLL